MSAGFCRRCREVKAEVRGGFCWDCCNAAEGELASRSVVGHVFHAIAMIVQGHVWEARADLTFAYQRARRVEAYAPGGYFDRQGHNWR